MRHLYIEKIYNSLAKYYVSYEPSHSCLLANVYACLVLVVILIYFHGLVWMFGFMTLVVIYRVIVPPY